MGLPRPYYEDSMVTIYHADCRDILPLLKVDAVVTDPPYGNGTEYGSYDDTAGNLERLVADVVPMMREAAPVALITSGTRYMKLYPAPDWVMGWFVPSGNGVGPWGFICWHPILVYGKDPYRPGKEGSRPDAFDYIPSQAENYGHPCSKPVAVMRWMVMRATREAGQTVLDPFMGSGTTLRAAKDLGRKAIGIEVEEKYCEIAARRMSQLALPLEM